MSFDNKIRRRKWTEEEKHNTLKACGSKCACCGTKLNMKTLTIEHVVPISKGGENVEENFVVLCKSCNSRKGNKFAWPCGYYMALENIGKLITVENYTKKWVAENVTVDTIRMFPMVAETISGVLRVNNNVSTKTYVPQFIFDIFEVTTDTLTSVCKGTGVSKQALYKTLVKQDDMFSLIGIKMRTSDKLLSLYTIQCVSFEESLNDSFIILSEVYTSSDKAGTIIPDLLLKHIAGVWYDLGVNGVIVRNITTKLTSILIDKLFNNSSDSIKLPCYWGQGKDVEYPGVDAWCNRDSQLMVMFKSKSEGVINAAKSELR